jgi:hypothetical protein
MVKHFNYRATIGLMVKNNRLAPILNQYKEMELGPDRLSGLEMGYIYEELLRRFSEQSGEEAGEHFTPREVIRLMVELLEIPIPDRHFSIYDPAGGTGGMLSVSKEHLLDRAATPEEKERVEKFLTVHGQEMSPTNYAICQADLLVKNDKHARVFLGNSLIFNGSPLSNGDCGSGESEIRRWILENDWLDAIVMLPDELFYNTGIFTYIWLMRNEKPADHRGRVMLIDARQQFEKEPKSFGNKRNRITDAHRQWIEQRYREGWVNGYADEQVKLFHTTDFAYHKVKVVFWQTDEHDQPAIITEPYEKTLTAASLAKEQAFHDSDLTFRVRVKMDDKEKTVEFVLKPVDSAAKKLKAARGDQPEILSIEWTHRHYVQVDKYIPHGEDIEAFLKREIAKPIIRWEDSPQLGCDILPNKYFYRYQPPTPAKELLEEFWRLEKEAEKMVNLLEKGVSAR